MATEKKEENLPENITTFMPMAVSTFEMKLPVVEKQKNVYTGLVNFFQLVIFFENVYQNGWPTLYNNGVIYRAGQLF